MADHCEAAGWWLEWICLFPGLGPFLGPIISAILAAGSAFFIGHLYTRRVKQSEAILEFSKRFQSLLESRHKLNVRFYCNESTGLLSEPIPVPSQKDEWEAWNLFRQFFDLMSNEFNYFQDNVIHEGVFSEWMLWRWYDWDPARSPASAQSPPGGLDIPGLETCSISYQKGWNWWVDRPVIGNTRFVNFMNELHAACDESAARKVVTDWSPRRRRVI